MALCFGRTLATPPLFSFNNGVPFLLRNEFENSYINGTSAHFCVGHEAFENGTLKMRVMIQNDGTSKSNPVTLHANPGMSACWMQYARVCSVGMWACFGYGVCFACQEQ